MTIGFFGGWVEMRCFGGRRKKQMKWQKKRSRLKQNIRKSSIWLKCRFLQKLWNQAPAPLTHTHTLITLVLNDRGCYLSHFKSGRGGEGQFTFQKRWNSLFLEKHIQQSTLLYQPAAILETACALCISLLESCRAIKTDNIGKWCPRVADLKLSVAMVYMLISTAHQTTDHNLFMSRTKVNKST